MTASILGTVHELGDSTCSRMSKGLYEGKILCVVGYMETLVLSIILKVMLTRPVLDNIVVLSLVPSCICYHLTEDKV